MKKGNSYTSALRTADGVKMITTGVVWFIYADGNYLLGTVTITATGVEIDWTLAGALTDAYGNRQLIILATTH